MRAGGCQNVVLVGARHLTLMRHYPEEKPSPEISEALSVLPPETDLVMVEGYKWSDFPKLEIYRPANGKAPLWTDVPGVVAVATDVPEEVSRQTTLPVLKLSDVDAIYAWIRAYLDR